MSTWKKINLDTDLIPSIGRNRGEGPEEGPRKKELDNCLKHTEANMQTGPA